MTAAEKYLISVDPRFEPLVAKYGPCELVRDEQHGTVYEALMRAILFQQLSGKAASTIQGRLYALFPGHECPPSEELLKLSIEEFRAVGVSRQKAGYLLDLAAKEPGLPESNELETLDDEEIIQRLIPIKGVGRWSVEMLLMFKLGRPDVLPVDDMGVQEGFRRHFGLDARPKKAQMIELAELWKPYRSSGSWYMWRLCEEKL
jgi:DNA-3-methyladenine glycosylase II